MMTTGRMPGSYLIAGGGTGGHVFPALAIAGEIRKQRPEAPIVFVGTERGLEAELVPKAGFALEPIRARGLIGKGVKARAEGMAALPLALADSWRLLSKHSPRAVIWVGGYAAGPVVATASARGIPTVIHESNAVPGVTNRLLSGLVDRIAVANEEGRRALPGAVITGNPVRPEFFGIPVLSVRSRPGRFRVLVVGGSQGAAILNRLLPGALGALRAAGLEVEVVHQCGRRGWEGADSPGGVRTLYRQAGFPPEVVREFLHDIPVQLAASDLVVCRSGAMTVSEVAAAGRPALFVPLATATHGHQEANARTLERAAAAIVVTEREADEGRLGDVILRLANDPSRLEEMGRAARLQARPDAVEQIVGLIFAAEAEA